MLSQGLRNRIAAGEVIERPASVVKELVENSLDAGASRISIEVLRAGRRLIKVSDNGAGMDRDDACLALERYATSKLREDDDLTHIQTLGFRGEALSSIAAVSKVRLVTGSGAGPGTCIDTVAGVPDEVRESPASGTSLEVRDLFFNTPARLKFLKSDSTENYHIIDAVTREALAHPGVGFVLRADGREVINLSPATGVRERIVQVFGLEFASALREADLEGRDRRVTLFAGDVSLLRSNRNGQFIFVNGRSVRDQTVSSALYKAYGGLLPRDRHPVFLIYLDIGFEKVDVNVHPAKREVRLDDAQVVYRLVYEGGRAALNGSVPAEGSGPAGNPFDSPEARPGEARPGGEYRAHPAEQVGEAAGVYTTGPALYLGETFVACAEEGGLLILDYHAAHERINYERFLRAAALSSWQLLFPRPVKLPPAEFRVLLDNRDLLGRLGFDLEDFGHETIAVRGLPEVLRESDLRAVLSDFASVLLENDPGAGRVTSLPGGEGPLEGAKRKLAARLACHSSVRGAEVPDSRRIAALLGDLAATADPDHCPHGRPTKVFISAEKLRKMFKK
jgi:DNA mismatch repair protein MutL